MNTLLLISLIILFLTLPFILVISIILIFNKFSKKIKIEFNISGFYKLSNIRIKFCNPKNIFILYIKQISLELIWFRMRIMVKNFGFIGRMESLESEEILELVEMIMKKIKLDGLSAQKLENSLRFLHKKNKYTSKIFELLDKYNLPSKKERNIIQIAKLEDINKHLPKISFLERIISILIVLFDMQFIDMEVFFELTKSDSLYTVTLEKMHFGVLKGQTRLNDYDFYGFFNNLKLFEYRKLSKNQENNNENNFNNNDNDQNNINNNYNYKNNIKPTKSKTYFSISEKIRSIDPKNPYLMNPNNYNNNYNNFNNLNENNSNRDKTFKIFQFEGDEFENKEDLKIINNLRKLISQSFDNYLKFDLINISGLNFKLSFYDGFNFLFAGNKTNSLGIKIEVNKVKINFTMKSIKILIKNIIQLILLGKKESIINKKIDLEIPEKTNPIEKLVFKEMQTNLKKFKLILKDVNLNFKSDNDLMTDFSLKMNKFSFVNMINLHFKTEKSQKIVSSNMDLNFQDIIMQINEKNQIINIPDYSLMIVEDINYIREKKEAQIKKSISSDLSNFFITAHSEKMNKIMEFILEIVEGIDKIDTITIPLKKTEFYNCNSEISLNFKGFNITLYNENVLLNVNNLSLFLKIDQQKFKEQKISILLSPLIISVANPFDGNRTINTKNSLINFWEKSGNKIHNKNFFDEDNINNFEKKFYEKNLNSYNENFNNFNNDKHFFSRNEIEFDTNEFYYVSEIFLNNFKIEIYDTKEYRNIKIIFGFTNLRVYDNHLLDVMAFIPEFLKCIFHQNVKKKLRLLNNKTNPFKSNKKETLILTFDTVNLIKIFDFEEIVTLTFHNFEFMEDKHLKVDDLVLYHRNAKNLLYKKKTKFLEIKGFRMEFSDIILNLNFKDIKINYYCIELTFLISKMVMYYQFMPEWIDWQFDGQFLIDKENREIFVQDSARIKNVEILFSLITIEISENSLVTCGIFDSEFQGYDYEIKDKKGLKDVLKELKSLKKEFSFHIIVRNFGLKIYNYFEESVKNYYDKINQENNFKYFESTLKTIDTNLFFKDISIFTFYNKILELNDLNINIKKNKIFNNFNPNKKINYVLMQNRNILYFNLTLRENVVNSQVKIDAPNLFLSTKVKLFDKTIAFAFRFAKVIMKFPIKDYDIWELSDMKEIFTYSRLTIIVKNIILSINGIEEFEKNIINKKKNKFNNNKEEAKEPRSNLKEKKNKKTSLISFEENHIINDINHVNHNIIRLKNEEENSELKLELKISFCAIDLFESVDTNLLEITSFGFKFGFEDTHNIERFPLIVLPILEVNYDLSENTLRVNIPSKELSLKQKYGNNYSNFSNNEILPNNLENFINNLGNLADEQSFKNINTHDNHINSALQLKKFLLESKSFTIFINYNHLEVSTKIFENFLDIWNITLKKYFKFSAGNNNEEKESNNLNNQENENNFINLNTESNNNNANNTNILYNQERKNTDSDNNNILEQNKTKNLSNLNVSPGRSIFKKNNNNLNRNSNINIPAFSEINNNNNGRSIFINKDNNSLRNAYTNISNNNNSNNRSILVKQNSENFQNFEERNSTININNTIKSQNNTNVYNIQNFNSSNSNNINIPNNLSIYNSGNLNNERKNMSFMHNNTNISNVNSINNNIINNLTNNLNKKKLETDSTDKKINNFYRNNFKSLNSNNNNFELDNILNSDPNREKNRDRNNLNPIKKEDRTNRYLKLKYGDKIPKFKIEKKPPKISEEEENQKNKQNKKQDSDTALKIFIALFDFKIIYHVNYNKENPLMESIFSHNSLTKERGYFGYIIRIYSSSLSYEKTKPDAMQESKDKLKAKMHLFSLSYLDSVNMNDESYFHYDNDISRYFKTRQEIKKILKNENDRKSFMNSNNNNNITNNNNINPQNSNGNNDTLNIINQLSNLNSNNYNSFSNFNNNNSSGKNFNFKNLNSLNFNNINIEDNNNNDEFYKDIKIESEFLAFMELKKSFKYKYLNDLTFDFFEIDREHIIKLQGKSRNLSVESRNVIIKIINTNFKRISQKQSENMLIKVNRFEILYNKYNKDLLQLIVFEDLLKIVDKIILKLDLEKDGENNNNMENNTQNSDFDENKRTEFLKKDKDFDLYANEAKRTNSDKDSNNNNPQSNNNNTSVVTRRKTVRKKDKKKNKENLVWKIGSLKFYFSLRNPKIHIENEIKGSHIILVSEEECSVELSDIGLDYAKKDFILNINLKKMNLLSYTKYEKSIKKIVESPEIHFNISNNFESKLDKIISKNSIAINLPKIRGFFHSKDFQDFKNVVEILIYDRTESLAVEKKKIDDRNFLLDAGKKLTDIRGVIEKKNKENSIKANDKPLKTVKFNINEVDLALKEKDENKIQLIITQFHGSQTIYSREDRLSDSKIYLGDVKLISSLDEDINETKYLFSKMENKNSKNRPRNKISFDRFGNNLDTPIYNLQPLISLEKLDKYVILKKEDLNLDKASEWFYIINFKLLIQPLSINIYKNQIDFLLDFFRMNKTIEEEDTLNKKKEVIQEDDELDQSFPIYFKEVNVSPSEMKLNFYYSDESLINIRNASIKIANFIKSNKFYQFQDLVNRFKAHCKLQILKIIGDIVSNIFEYNNDDDVFNNNENNNNKTSNFQEKILKGGLFGNTSNLK